MPSSGDNVELVDSRNCYVQSSGPLTVLVGMEDAVVVVENDAVMVTKREQVPRRSRAHSSGSRRRSHPAWSRSRRVYRPWGYYQTLDLGARFQVKRILVDPGQKLSLQSHHHRAEHWVVVQGTAIVTRDAKEEVLAARERVDLSAARLRPPPGEPRARSRSRSSRSSPVQLSRRGRHRPLRRRLSPDVIAASINQQRQRRTKT
jgi:quercetin dioxygenase-like cupin family protein